MRLAAMSAGLVARGVDPGEAQHKALALMDASVNLQSAVLSFSR